MVSKRFCDEEKILSLSLFQNGRQISASEPPSPSTSKSSRSKNTSQSEIQSRGTSKSASSSITPQPSAKNLAKISGDLTWGLTNWFFQNCKKIFSAIVVKNCFFFFCTFSSQVSEFSSKFRVYLQRLAQRLGKQILLKSEKERKMKGGRLSETPFMLSDTFGSGYSEFGERRNVIIASNVTHIEELQPVHDVLASLNERQSQVCQILR